MHRTVPAVTHLAIRKLMTRIFLLCPILYLAFVDLRSVHVHFEDMNDHCAALFCFHLSLIIAIIEFFKVHVTNVILMSWYSQRSRDKLRRPDSKIYIIIVIVTYTSRDTKNTRYFKKTKHSMYGHVNPGISFIFHVGPIMNSSIWAPNWPVIAAPISDASARGRRAENPDGNTAVLPSFLPALRRISKPLD